MTEDASAARPILLEAVAAEIEAFAGQAGWDQPPTLYALVPTRTLAADPAAAALLGDATPADIPDGAVTPIAQEPLPDGPLDETLARIGWPDEVVGCALCQEIVLLPPSAEAEFADLDIEGLANRAVHHPDRREARLVVAVLRSGQAASILRLRGAGGEPEDLLTGADLAPNLASALAATLAE